MKKREIKAIVKKAIKRAIKEINLSEFDNPYEKIATYLPAGIGYSDLWPEVENENSIKWGERVETEIDNIWGERVETEIDNIWGEI